MTKKSLCPDGSPALLPTIVRACYHRLGSHTTSCHLMLQHYLMRHITTLETGLSRGVEDIRKSDMRCGASGAKHVITSMHNFRA